MRGLAASTAGLPSHAMVCRLNPTQPLSGPLRRAPAPPATVAAYCSFDLAWSPCILPAYLYSRPSSLRPELHPIKNPILQILPNSPQRRAPIACATAKAEAKEHTLPCAPGLKALRTGPCPRAAARRLGRGHCGAGQARLCRRVRLALQHGRRGGPARPPRRFRTLGCNLRACACVHWAAIACFRGALQANGNLAGSAIQGPHNAWKHSGVLTLFATTLVLAP